MSYSKFVGEIFCSKFLTQKFEGLIWNRWFQIADETKFRSFTVKPWIILSVLLLKTPLEALEYMYLHLPRL